MKIIFKFYFQFFKTEICKKLFFIGDCVTYMTMAEFFMMRPHGPKFWKGLGALRDRVRLKETKRKMPC